MKCNLSNLARSSPALHILKVESIPVTRPDVGAHLDLVFGASLAEELFALR